MKHKLLCCTAFMCGIFTFPFASALEYHYSADLYPNHFYAPTSSNRALDIDSADNSGGAAIIVPSAGMGTDATAQRPAKAHPSFRSVRMLIRGVTPWNRRSTQTKS